MLFLPNHDPRHPEDVVKSKKPDDQNMPLDMGGQITHPRRAK
jgi:hypothetical protein